jgi:hypothetical protein
MPNLLHPTRYRELLPEFEAADHLQAAKRLLEGSTSRATGLVDEALRNLHPVALDPAAHKEMAELIAAERPSSTSKEQDVVVDGMGRSDEVAELRKRLAAYENAPTSKDA